MRVPYRLEASQTGCSRVSGNPSAGSSFPSEIRNLVTALHSPEDLYDGEALPVNIREARLKPEFAAEYPDLTPEVWLPATELARKLIERAHTRRREGRHTRTFDPTHFEFRGGLDRPRSRGSRTRKTDLPKERGEHPGSAERRAEA